MFSSVLNLFPFLRPVNSKQDFEDDVKLALDAVFLSDPRNYALTGVDFFIVETDYQAMGLGNKPRQTHHITQLSELDIEVEYVTQKGTTVKRNDVFQVCLGGKIFIPIYKQNESYLVTKSRSAVCVKGKLHKKFMLNAIHGFTGSTASIESGIQLTNSTTQEHCLVLTIDELELGVKYFTPSDTVWLIRHEDDQVEFEVGRNIHGVSHEYSTPVTTELSLKENIEKIQSRENINDQVTKSVIQHRQIYTRKGRAAQNSKPNLTAPRGIVTPVIRKETQGKENSKFQANSSPKKASPKKSLSSPKKSPTKKGGNNSPHNSPSKPVISPNKRKDTTIAPTNAGSSPKKLKPTELTNPTTTASQEPLVIEDMTSEIQSNQMVVTSDSPMKRSTAGRGPPPRGPKKLVPAPIVDLTPKRKVKNLHWKSIPKTKIRNTFWSEIDGVELGVSEASEINQALQNEILDLFSLSPTKETPSTPRKEIKPVLQALIDSKRSNNTSILLSQFKMPHSEIREAVLSLDQTVLSCDKIATLRYMFPLTNEEIKALENFDGDKSTRPLAEQFYLEMLTIPRIDNRLGFLQFKFQYQEMLDSMIAIADILARASNEVKESDQFAKILKWVMTLGNVLNQNTRLASSGFSLESLSSLAETRSKGTSFLDCLVKYIDQHNPEILNFHEQLPNIDSGSKVVLETETQQRQEIKSILDQLESELKFQQNNPSNVEGDLFLDVMMPFYEEAKRKFSEYIALMDGSISAFNSLVNYYGDDHKKSNPKLFFQNLITFSGNFRRVHRELTERKLRSERSALKLQQKKVQDEKVVEQQKQQELEKQQKLQQEEKVVEPMQLEAEKQEQTEVQEEKKEVQVEEQPMQQEKEVESMQLEVQQQKEEVEVEKQQEKEVESLPQQQDEEKVVVDQSVQETEEVKEVEVVEKQEVELPQQQQDDEIEIRRLLSQEEEDDNEVQVEPIQQEMHQQQEEVQQKVEVEEQKEVDQSMQIEVQKQEQEQNEDQKEEIVQQEELVQEQIEQPIQEEEKQEEVKQEEVEIVQQEELVQQEEVVQEEQPIQQEKQEEVKQEQLMEVEKEVQIEVQIEVQQNEKVVEVVQEAEKQEEVEVQSVQELKEDVEELNAVEMNVEDQV